jgi:steroid delta-isomerase-like uncharacterized protein
MSAKEIKALMRRWFEECNKGQEAFMAVFDELHAADIVIHGGTGEEIRGLKDFKQYCMEWLSAFPDLHFTIKDMVAEGDRVAVRSTWTGTHKGGLKGISPTNKKVTSWEIEIDRIAEGKIAEVWTRYDTLGVMQQLSLAPTSRKGK